MRVQILAMGTKMPAWVQEGCETYLKRLPREFSVAIKELPLANRGKSTATAQVIEREGQQLLEAADPSHRLIALDSGGKQWSTEELAQQLADWRMEGTSVSLLVGGPDGLSDACRQRARHCWSLSKLTLPHPLVRVLLAEQLYRAWSLLNNHPYHK